MILAESSIGTIREGALNEDSMEVALNFQSGHSLQEPLHEPSIDSIEGIEAAL